MLAVERVEIGPDETRVDLEKRLAVIGANLMLAVVQDLDNFRKNSLMQDEQNVTYGKMFVVANLTETTHLIIVPSIRLHKITFKGFISGSEIVGFMNFVK